MKYLLTFISIYIFSLPVFCQKEVDYVREIYCEKVVGFSPAGQLFSEYFNSEYTEHHLYKLVDYQNGEIYTCDFEGY